MPIRPQAPAAEKPNPYSPPGPGDPLVFEEFQGINTAVSRSGVPDQQMAWCDGFMPLGRRNLRTLYGLGPVLFTPTGGRTIAFFGFYNIGATPSMLSVLSDGSVWTTNTATSVSGLIANPGTVTGPSITTLGITQWGNLYVILVSSASANGYWIWDGTTFYVPGGSAPGGGTMPTAIAGSAVEVYAGRVWVMNGSVISFSAPGSFKDFSTANGGGNFSSSDSFLRVAFSNLKQTNGFLYLIADSSINYLSGVQTSGSPPTTTFTNQNADPEVGTPWAATVDVFGRNIVFANAFGAHISYGAAVTKISEPLDGVYNTVPNFSGVVTPSAAKAIIFGHKIWILLLPIIDPYTGQQVNKLFMWDGKKWWSTQQEIGLTYIQHQEINSIITAWGTDTHSVWPLFQTPSQGFTKVVQSRFWDTPGGYEYTKAAVRLWGLFYLYNLTNRNISINVDNEVGTSPQSFALTPASLLWFNNSGQQILWTGAGGAPLTWLGALGSVSVLPPAAAAQQGVLTGLTLVTNALDMAIVSVKVQDEIVGYRG